MEAHTEFQETPLYLAAAEGHEAVFRLLVEHGADIKARED
jgi:ankyrin repeat protein